MKQCICGAALPDGAIYCGRCGRSIPASGGMVSVNTLTDLPADSQESHEDVRTGSRQHPRKGLLILGVILAFIGAAAIALGFLLPQGNPAVGTLTAAPAEGVLLPPDNFKDRLFQSGENVVANTAGKVGDHLSGTVGDAFGAAVDVTEDVGNALTGGTAPEITQAAGSTQILLYAGIALLVLGLALAAIYLIQRQKALRA